MKKMKFIKKKIGFILLPILLLNVGILFTNNLSSDLKITAIDVGQGDCFLISMAQKNAVMIDGGSTSKQKIAEYTIVPTLKSKGISIIKYWFISHCDLDHVSGLIEILNNYNRFRIEIENIVLPAYRLNGDEYDKIINLANKVDIRVINIARGDVIKLKNTSFDCAFPYDTDFLDHNDESMNLILSYKDFQMLFTGDLGSNRDNDIIKYLEEKYADVSIEVLKLGHHGSQNSTSTELLEKIDPVVAIISSGEDNKYGHPHHETLKKLKEASVKYYNTADTGQVDIVTNGLKFRVSALIN